MNADAETIRKAYAYAHKQRDCAWWEWFEAWWDEDPETLMEFNAACH